LKMFTHLVEKQLHPRMGPPLTLKKLPAKSSLTLLKNIGPGLYNDFVKWGREKRAGGGRRRQHCGDTQFPGTQNVQSKIAFGFEW
jgi:hypothetical protein